MTTLAFKDARDGYYQVEVVDGNDPPAWTHALMPCALQIVSQPDAKDAIRAQIVAMECQQLMPRATREFMLLFMEANATPEVLAVNYGYQAVKAFDNQIAALRAQL